MNTLTSGTITAPPPLASRFLRLLAFLIDAIPIMAIGLLLYAPILIGFDGVELPQDAAAQLSLVAPYMPVLTVVAGVLIIIQIALLTLRGQTIGKWIFRMKIVRKDTLTNGGFTTNVVLREFVSTLPSAVLFLFWYVIDGLFIFRSDRRCIHDLIAGTIVVKI